METEATNGSAGSGPAAPPVNLPTQEAGQRQPLKPASGALLALLGIALLKPLEIVRRFIR